MYKKNNKASLDQVLTLQAIKTIIQRAQDQEANGKSNASDIIPASVLQSALAGQFSGTPDFASFAASLQMALAGNLSSFLQDEPLTIESVVALPLECGDFGMFKRIISPC